MTFQINEEGILVDNLGFPLTWSLLEDVSQAAEKSLALGPEKRIALARTYCEKNFPGMLAQIDFEKLEAKS